VAKVNQLWALLRPAHHVRVSSGCLPSEYLVADEAPAHSLRYDEDLANGVCAGGRGAIFLSAHDFPPVLGSPDAELRARRLQTPACS
jgi:hypothetical protein